MRVVVGAGSTPTAWVMRFTYRKVPMAVRYDVITEWHGDQKRYRIYDKEADQLLASYETLQEACAQCAALPVAEGSARSGGPGPGE